MNPGTKGVTCNLGVLLKSRNLNLTELSQKVGISYANLSVLKNNHAKAIRFSTLEALCEALDCEIGELFEFREAHTEEQIQ
jgi:putative transcriptional regulator